MADLVEPENEVARRINPRDAGALMTVDLEAGVARQTGSDHLGEQDMRVRSQRRINAGEVMASALSDQGDGFLTGLDRGHRAVDQRHPHLVQFGAQFVVEFVRQIGGDEGQVGGVAAQEAYLGGPTLARPDHRDLLVGHLIPVADRAIADQPARHGVVVQFHVHRRTAIGNPGREQHGLGGDRPRSPFGDPGSVTLFEPAHLAGFDLGAIELRLFSHPA